MTVIQRLSVLLLLAAATAALPLAAAEDPKAIAGTYTGEVFNGNDMDAVTTTFSFDNSGRLVGKYEVDEENGKYRGRLSNFMFEGPRTISMEWTDKFGEGFATMEFTQGFRSFTGAWTTKAGTDSLPWSGKKTAP
jgi:hypothetical protein